MDELSNRQAKNSSYSLRSFAKNLGISPTLLSQLLSSQRSLTERTANLIIEKCSLDPEEAKKVFSEIGSIHKIKKAESDELELSIDSFKLISEWEHYAILALSSVDKNFSDPCWIAKRLNIPEQKAKKAFERLLALNLIKKKGKGFVQTSNRVKTPNDIPSSAIKKYHSQNLDKAKNSLYENTVEERYFGSLTVAIDPSDLEKYKKIIRRTRKQIGKLSDEGKNKQVYHFSSQFFPIDKGESK